MRSERESLLVDYLMLQGYTRKVAERMAARKGQSEEAPMDER